MKKYRFLYKALAVVSVVFTLMACDQKEDPQPTPPTPTPEPKPVVEKPSAEMQQADQFSIDLLSVYYLWNKEVENDVKRLTPDTCKTPISVVNEIRYHQGTKEVDHWTQLTNNLESFTNSVQGLGLSYGYDLQAGRISNKNGVYFLLVCYVANDSPASKAGIKRGDIIISIDGKEITSSNIYDALNTQAVTLGITRLTSDGYIGSDERPVSLEAIKMWENPILLIKTFDVNGKKVGYLVYNSFDLKSATLLPDVFRQFKEDGVEELILDLRYNGGGYAFTECELASMIAPIGAVSAGDVFQTEVYNSILAEEWKRQGNDTNTYFSTKHTFKDDTYDIKEDITDANPGIKKLYAIVTGGSASASEGLLIGLMPYMSVSLIGQQTYGKYCAGWMISPSSLYGSASTFDYSKITKWGMYVMVSKFADKNGNNPAMPDGIPVNIEAEDNPFDGFQLGDEEETMLKAALTAAGKVYTRSAVESRKPMQTDFIEHGVPRGILIKTDIPTLK